MLRYLALLLLAPWLLILGWAYFAYPKGLPRTAARRLFDGVALLLAAVAAAWCAAYGFEAAPPPQVDAFGRASGAIWQQVLPALLGYGACVAVLVVALLVRHLLWRAVDR
ncbi:MAG: hypothetical protein HOQ10_02730 [Frateuria sp.]|uniref:hypothetical protein n=1 Tax=Frateuria sp. TaxID=2211372 RepID=UPI0017A82C6F|nr:hypothetical protein [Frateuria sp.]NUO71616.1 hypothetical protein [Frateuria sp.]NUR22323.1 hypothetical protein [Frateuria sp.]